MEMEIIVFHTIIINKLGNSFDFHQNHFSVYLEDVEQSTRHLERFTIIQQIPTLFRKRTGLRPVRSKSRT